MNNDFWRNWGSRIAAVALTIILGPRIIDWIAKLFGRLTSNLLDHVESFVTAPMRYSGSAEIEALLKVCLWLIVLTILARYFFSRKG